MTTALKLWMRLAASGVVLLGVVSLANMFGAGLPNLSDWHGLFGILFVFSASVGAALRLGGGRIVSPWVALIAFVVLITGLGFAFGWWAAGIGLVLIHALFGLGAIVMIEVGFASSGRPRAPA